MTEQEYEIRAESIATCVWEISTDNGRDLSEDLWDSHKQNCYDAVHNSYYDGISVVEWMTSSLNRL